MSRRATVERKTNETAIELTLDARRHGPAPIATPVPFFNHMLEAVARHGLFDLEVKATGDVEVDAHHTVEESASASARRFARRSATGAASPASARR